MKSLFKVGQAVTPNVKNGKFWKNQYSSISEVQPKFGDIYHVYAIDQENGKVYLELREFPRTPSKIHTFGQEYFSPIISDKQLEDALNEVDELLTVKNTGALT